MKRLILRFRLRNVENRKPKRIRTINRMSGRLWKREVRNA